jgi:hypothetical protein
MRTVLLVFATGCTTTWWHGDGTFSASYTSPDGTTQTLQNSSVVLLEVPSGTKISLCDERTLHWQIDLPLATVANGQLVEINTDLDSALCGTGLVSVTRGQVRAWTGVGPPVNNPQEAKVDGWTVDGTLDVTSYVRHKASDPPPRNVFGTPLESIAGTFGLELTHTSGATAEIANGTFTLDTYSTEEDDWKGIQSRSSADAPRLPTAAVATEQPL